MWTIECLGDWSHHFAVGVSCDRLRQSEEKGIMGMLLHVKLQRSFECWQCWLRVCVRVFKVEKKGNVNPTLEMDGHPQWVFISITFLSLLSLWRGKRKPYGPKPIPMEIQWIGFKTLNVQCVHTCILCRVSTLCQQ